MSGPDPIEVERFEITLKHDLQLELPDGVTPIDLSAAYSTQASGTITLPAEKAGELRELLAGQHVTLQMRHDLNPHHRQARGVRARIRRWRDIVRFDWARLRGRDPVFEAVVTIPDVAINTVPAAEPAP